VKLPGTASRHIKNISYKEEVEPMATTEPRRFKAGTLKFEVYDSRAAAGEAAARDVAAAMQAALPADGDLGVIFATGASQLSVLRSLVKLQDVPWNRIDGFHMDEYVGIAADHFASFRQYMRLELTSRVPIKAFHGVEGNASDVEAACATYAAALKAANPQICLLGIGENGHLAFNDPYLCDFHDPLDVRVVSLDRECREQQVAEGWFPSVEAVPGQAITLTIPALVRVPKLIVSVPGIRKASIVRRVIEDEISNACPATLLKTHADATVYLDDESSSELGDLLKQAI
jgi:glucosamine-6-phosphate deaminase